MKWIIIVLAGVVTASCVSSQPYAEAAGVGSKQAPFANYRTFAFAPANAPRDGYIVTERSLEVQRRLALLLQKSLEKRGYTRSEQNPDLLIKVTAGSGTIWGEKTQHGNAAESVPSGFIGFDAYERTTGADVWHGSGFAEIDPRRIDDALLTRGVEKMLEGFPSRDEALAKAD